MKRQWFILPILLFGLGGCSMLDAWKGNLDYNHETGQLEGDLKGAGKGGEYNENVGLNLTSGDNTVPALIVVGVLGIGVIFAYPIQRALRLASERKTLASLKRSKRVLDAPEDE